jgi:hypothetical protein
MEEIANRPRSDANRQDHSLDLIPESDQQQGTKQGGDKPNRTAKALLSHAPVNRYIKRIGKVNSARCPACGAEQETIEHFLLEGPSYAQERWALNRQAKKLRKQLTLETLRAGHGPTASKLHGCHASIRKDM